MSKDCGARRRPHSLTLSLNFDNAEGQDEHGCSGWPNARERGSRSLTGDVAWNFNKWLIGRDGRLVARSSSNVAPGSQKITGAIEAALAK